MKVLGHKLKALTLLSRVSDSRWGGREEGESHFHRYREGSVYHEYATVDI